MMIFIAAFSFVFCFVQALPLEDTDEDGTIHHLPGLQDFNPDTHCGFREPFMLQTYDFVLYPHRGHCKYQAASFTHPNKTEPFIEFFFKTEIAYQSIDFGVFLYMELKYKKDSVRMYKNQTVTLNGEHVPSPVMSGLHDFGDGIFQIWNWHRTISVRVKEERWVYMRVHPAPHISFNKRTSASVDGLCGNNNDVFEDDFSYAILDDDNTDKSGAEMNNTWQVFDSEEPECEDGEYRGWVFCNESYAATRTEPNYCGILNMTNYAPFRDCMATIGRTYNEMATHSCNQEVCWEIPDWNRAHGAACAYLGRVAQECERNGHHVDWREATDCTMKTEL
ncbi:hypothetical protein CAPTEDRAFT_215631 [Capitella teleta]|uniref:VWFD domain-containing protein n=1 Tax=Capitella teleta TaxID=283909 RepID=R7T680_CAPTE|nr:hypothetical protein CAPTEDRAFT_215631 [Capitella teleta]|eukprot:ELT88925.1 hypothetical protein CAPTEDRAFT_215631 [Capitella teleta]